MPILLKLPSQPVEKWAIVELQGDLQSHSDASLEEKFIGDLHFLKSGIPILIIGHHLLYGKEVKMEKPLALLEKKKTDETGTAYTVKALINMKILFRTRPKPIVSDL